MDIKPIETIYNGYRFRSRLEARWAVFFDSAGIPYEYEPEGFILSDGTYYLPDFYLPWFHAYVEIKRANIPYALKEEAMRKCQRLFDCAGSCIVLFCEGDPAENEMQVYCNYSDDEGGGTTWFFASFIEGGWYADDISIHSGGKHFITIAIYEPGSFFDSDYNDVCLESFYCLDECRSELEQAKSIARQARFEHGESPN